MPDTRAVPRTLGPFPLMPSTLLSLGDFSISRLPQTYSFSAEGDFNVG